MNELIKVELDENREQIVSGRELHEFLEVKTAYKDWIRRMIEYGFAENIDYIAIAQKRATAQGNMTTYTDHVLKIDMAKEIAMLQRNEKGKQARQYFIKCEKEYKQFLLQATDKADKEISLLNAKARVAELWMRLGDRTSIPEYRQITDSYASLVLAGKPVLPLPEVNQKTYSATEIADILGVTPQKIGRLSNANNLKTKEYGKWFYDKSQHSSKEVETFRYFDSAIPVFKELLA